MKIDEKSYDVVILTHAPHDELIVTLKRLLSQTVKARSIIIYNTDKSIFYKNIERVDELKSIIEDNNDIKVVNIDEACFDHGKARNDAAKLSDAKYILYLTDDAVPYDETLAENMIKGFEKYDEKDHKVSTVYARQIAKDSARLKEKYIREFNYPDYDVIKEKERETELGIKNYFCSNVCAMYDREIFYKLGCFEENIILNEDTFYVYNAINKGYKVVYYKDAKVYHSHNLSFGEQLSRNFDIGVSQSERREIFDKIPSTREGFKLFKYVLMKMLKGFHFIGAFDFIVECIYRYIGFRKGKNFKNLSIDECITLAFNKRYFIDMKDAKRA